MILPPSSASLGTLCQLLNQGECVVMPTETVYGLAVDGRRDEAIAKVYALKERPLFNPLILHVSSLDQALELGDFSEEALDLAQAFWPGPLTLVLPQKKGNAIAPLATAGLSTIALRCPSHPLARGLLEAFGGALAAPSANPSTRLSPTTAQAVERVFPHLMILDGGPCAVGLESTILDLTTSCPTLLRPGGLSLERLESFLKRPVVVTQKGKEGKVKAPGMLLKHYAPQRPLRLNARAKESGEALLGFGPDPLGYLSDLNLSPSGDVVEAASNLFRMLHELDREPYSGIAVVSIPQDGLGFAINDRLARGSGSKS